MLAAVRLSLSAEERALGALIGVDWSGASPRRVPSGWGDGADLLTLYRLSVRHGMTAMLAKALADDGVEPPSAVRQWIVARRQLLTRFALVQQAAIAAIFDRARAGGTRFLLLKGHALGVVLYADPFLRESADIDIFTDQSGMAELAAILTDIGFTETGAISSNLDPTARRLAHDMRNDRKFDRPDYVRVELHYRLAPQSADFADFELLWRDRERFTLLGRELATLGKAATLSSLLLHGTKHAWENWRWLVDIALAMRRTPAGDVETAGQCVGSTLFDSCLGLVAAISREPSLAPARLPLRARPLATAALFAARVAQSTAGRTMRRSLVSVAWQACLIRNPDDLRRQVDALLIDPSHIQRFSARRDLLYPARLISGLGRRLNRALKGREAGTFRR